MKTMEVTINIKHQIGDIVYLKTDVDQFDRIHIVHIAVQMTF